MGNVVNNIHVPPERPESELQAVFKQHTGIHCGREVREHLERLMAHHGFTGQELARAWNVGSLVWDQEARGLKSGSRKLDLVGGWAGVTTLTAALVVSLLEIMSRMPSPLVKTAFVLAICIAYLYVTRFVLLSTIFPQATARRVEKTLTLRG
ncbi:hypothetical protein [Acidovorax sp. SRB_24]|uniref:hypothetical protein n=1 Tax=Acidovorax sp. SRB_24 TaxID=1962700 RepID=UPI00145D725E|nr:hypothetical protein [Acidovorax sp. SRB_24]